jgi:hypothetical protein
VLLRFRYSHASGWKIVTAVLNATIGGLLTGLRERFVHEIPFCPQAYKYIAKNEKLTEGIVDLL